MTSANAETALLEVRGLVKNYEIGLRIFDSSNANLIQGKDEFAWYESTDYRTKFPALWTK